MAWFSQQWAGYILFVPKAVIQTLSRSLAFKIA